jgi:hypothetical protein
MDGRASSILIAAFLLPHSYCRAWKSNDTALQLAESLDGLIKALFR